MRTITEALDVERALTAPGDETPREFAARQGLAGVEMAIAYLREARVTRSGVERDELARMALEELEGVSGNLLLVLDRHAFQAGANETRGAA